jgi:hypothetical protein
MNIETRSSMGGIKAGPSMGTGEVRSFQNIPRSPVKELNVSWLGREKSNNHVNLSKSSGTFAPKLFGEGPALRKDITNSTPIWNSRKPELIQPKSNLNSMKQSYFEIKAGPKLSQESRVSNLQFNNTRVEWQASKPQRDEIRKNREAIRIPKYQEPQQFKKVLDARALSTKEVLEGSKLQPEKNRFDGKSRTFEQRIQATTRKDEKTQARIAQIRNQLKVMTLSQAQENRGYAIMPTEQKVIGVIKPKESFSEFHRNERKGGNPMLQRNENMPVRFPERRPIISPIIRQPISPVEQKLQTVRSELQQLSRPAKENQKISASQLPVKRELSLAQKLIHKQEIITKQTQVQRMQNAKLQERQNPMLQRLQEKTQKQLKLQQLTANATKQSNKNPELKKYGYDVSQITNENRINWLTNAFRRTMETRKDRNQKVLYGNQIASLMPKDQPIPLKSPFKILKETRKRDGSLSEFTNEISKFGKFSSLYEVKQAGQYASRIFPAAKPIDSEGTIHPRYVGEVILNEPTKNINPTNPKQKSTF